MDNFEYCLLICFVVGFIIIIGSAILSQKSTYISYGHKPFPNCVDCHGTGIVKDDVGCLCTMRVRQK